jgi:hypothetical protein
MNHADFDWSSGSRFSELARFQRFSSVEITVDPDENKSADCDRVSRRLSDSCRLIPVKS